VLARSEPRRQIPHEEPRFLYISATFRSGKTHLLKLIGFAAISRSEFLRREGYEQMAGLRVVPTERLADSRRPAEARLPEPPQPGRVTGTASPTSFTRRDRPRTQVSARPELRRRRAWLDMNHGDCWERLQEVGRRANVRGRCATNGRHCRLALRRRSDARYDSPFASQEEVRQSIDDASEVDPDSSTGWSCRPRRKRRCWHAGDQRRSLPSGLRWRHSWRCLRRVPETISGGLTIWLASG